MGLKLSSRTKESSSSSSLSAVRVITDDGSLLEFSLPILASYVLINTLNSSAFFLCDSDTLYFNAEISSVHPQELLLPGQLYFVLPRSLHRAVLTHNEMSSLALKATTALASFSTPKKRRGVRKIRVAPVLLRDRSKNKNAVNPEKDVYEACNRMLNEETVKTKYDMSVKKAYVPSKPGSSLPAKGWAAKGWAAKKRLQPIQEFVER